MKIKPRIRLINRELLAPFAIAGSFVAIFIVVVSLADMNNSFASSKGILTNPKEKAGKTGKAENSKGFYSIENPAEIIEKEPSTENEIKILSVLQNPITKNVELDFTVKDSGTVDVSLFNAYGQNLLQDKIQANGGLNSFEFYYKRSLSKGNYFISLVYNEKKITYKITE
jgi:hypothetical protein